MDDPVTEFGVSERGGGGRLTIPAGGGMAQLSMERFERLGHRLWLIFANGFRMLNDVAPNWKPGRRCETWIDGSPVIGRERQERDIKTCPFGSVPVPSPTEFSSSLELTDT